jgi:hypothetical protein
MGDGREWPLAAYVPCLGGVWDRLYDANVLSGKYSPADIRLAGSHLLRENFDLAPEAVATLIVGADLGALVVAVENAMFGPLREHRTWSDWAIGSLYANGIDPAAVPPSRLRSVLDVLIECKRTVPPGCFVSSAVAAPRLARSREKAEAQAELKRREAEDEAARLPGPSSLASTAATA